MYDAIFHKCMNIALHNFMSYYAGITFNVFSDDPLCSYYAGIIGWSLVTSVSNFNAFK